MIALILALAAQTVALPQPDVYGPPPAAGTPERLAYDAQLGGAKEDAAIEAWLAAHDDAPAATRAMLWHRLCVDYGVRVGGERHVMACRQSTALTGDAEDASDLKIAIALRGEPAVSSSGSAIVPLFDNPLGSKSANVTVNGITLQWLVDTGAEVTTIPESTAKMIGVRMLDGTTDVGTATTRLIAKLGIVDRLTIGTATVDHLPVLILPDAMLRLGGNYTIPAILGLPALAALHRVAWLNDGTRLALGDAAPEPSGTPVRVYWHEAGLGLPLTTATGTAGAQFDSGANGTALRRPGETLLTPAQLASATEHDAMLGGAGGYIRLKQRVLPDLAYTLAGTPLKSVSVAIEDNDDSAGRLGSDILPQLEQLTIDFDRMTLGTSPVAQPPH